MEYLFDLERAVEAVEHRVPYGKPGMRILLGGALVYAVLYVFRSLAYDFFWPATQLALSLIGARSVPHVSLLPMLPWGLAGVALSAATAIANRGLSKMYARMKTFEAALDKYRSVFWQPLGVLEKIALLSPA